ncbi:MAG: zinc metalloprotease HtpX [Planctomycetes bacterium]|nr:zinc metalloprotease HtpX [Planctomycetota bacterium]
MVNGLKTGILMVVLTCLLVLIGQVVGGMHGAIIMFVIAAGMNFITFFFSDRIVLAMYKAQPVKNRSDAPELYDAVEDQARRAGLPMPRVYIIPQEAPNAFATGRSPRHAAIAATTGLLRSLRRRELEGVVAHELAHVKHRDTLISTLVATLAGAIMMIASIGRFGLIFGGGRDREDRNPLGAILGILLLILAPIAAMLIQMAISRSREYAADADGARISGQPHALASALRRLEAAAHQIPMAAGPSTSHLFIVNPLTAEGIANLFRTHPRTADRIARLDALATREGLNG